jgi:L-fucose mutarotase
MEVFKNIWRRAWKELEMLKGVHPLLRGDLLLKLDQLGHGDTCLVADANFPAYGTSDCVIEIPGVDTSIVLDAILTVFQLDTYGGPAVTLMNSLEDTIAGKSAAEPMLKLFTTQVGETNVTTLSRQNFYDCCKAVKFVVRTGEMRPYGNVLLRKGVTN